MLIDGTLKDGKTKGFKELYDSILKGASWHTADHYYLLHDFMSYVETRIKVNSDFSSKYEFRKKCYINMCNAGKFSSDRTIQDYMIAGPSEILVLADGTTPPDWVAMDLFSQAEHDELAQSILLCPDAAYIDAVQEAIDRLLPTMPRAEIIAKSLTGRGALILTKDMEEACAISNRIAPEHLEVSSNDPHRWEPLLRHAGAIFLGAYTSESLGDYCAGPNHVLPTSGTARFSSPLGVYDFQKRSSLIEVSEAGAQTLGQIASVLAHGEGLQAHARAAEMRLKPSPKQAQG